MSDTNNAFIRRRDQLLSLKALRRPATEKVKVCPECESTIEKRKLMNSYYVCPHCGHYFTLGANRRIRLTMDRESFKELGSGIISTDPLDFPGYEDKLLSASERCKLSEAVLTGVGRIEGIAAAVAVLDSRFMMGSMGVAVGDKVSRLFEYASKRELPVVIFSASGGARMQEGILSLMQMAKTSAAVERFSENGGLYISVLTHPTTGGVTASFASLGDIMLAEPGALIGFAGPRVIEQTIGEKLPEGFQRSEYLLEHGFLDAIVERRDMRKTLSTIMQLHGYKGPSYTESLQNLLSAASPKDDDAEKDR